MSAQVNGHSAAPQVNGIEGGSKISAHEVGFQFVPQYYNFVNKNPERLHCFYTKRSHFSHGLAGDEKNTTAHGQAEIHQRILDLAYNQCKVWINSIDSQSSDRGGIIILVLGEISNNEGEWRKFAQTFFLAEQPNGYFVLNDIFRYLRDDDDEEVEEPAPAQPDLQNQPAIEVSAPAADEEQTEPEPAAEESVAAEPVREEAVTIAAPELPNGSTSVPEEAVVAAVPDKDIAPEEAPVIEEPAAVEAEAPVEVAEPQAESSAASAPAPAESPAPSAPLVNGNAPPAPAAAAPVTTPAPPAAPAKPKSWAALAAANASKPAWGSVAAAPAPPAAQPTPPPVAVAPKPAEPAAPAASGSAPQQRHPYYENALKITTSQCFVKLPNWSIENPTGGESMDETTLKTVASRFGEVKKVEIVKAKACAFVEFATIDGAKKAIIASLLPSQGGEGGVKYGEGKLNFETRKEKDERRPKGPPRGASDTRGGGRGGARVHVGGREGGEAQVNGGVPRGDAAGRGRGRGRGGATAAGGDRPTPRQ